MTEGRKGGKLNILGDEQDDPSQFSIEACAITGDEAALMMFFFNKEMNKEEERKNILFKCSGDPPEVKFMVRFGEKQKNEGTINKFIELIHNLKMHIFIVIDMTHVMDIIKRLNLVTRVLPLQSNAKESVIRVYGRTDEIDTLKRFCETPDPLEETPGSSFLKGENFQKRSPHDKQIDKSGATFQSFDAKVKLDFVTGEGLRVKIYKDAITKLRVDAIVNPADETLSNIGGVALVISKAAGNTFQKECYKKIKEHGPIPDGDNRVTSAGNLSYKYVIHAVGPRWSAYQNKHDCLHVLMNTIVNVLETARGCKVRKVAIPPISSGIFGVPKKACAAMYLHGIMKFSNKRNIVPLEEFHIIDNHDEVLDMVVEWFKKWQVNPSCLEINNVLTKVIDPGNQGFNRSQNRLKYLYPEEKKHYIHAQVAVRQEHSNASDGGNQGFNRNHNPHKYSYLEENKHNAGSQASGGQEHSNTSAGRNHSQAEDSDVRTMKGVFKSIHGNTDIHIYTSNILGLKNIDAVVVSESPSFSGEGGLAKSLLQNGDDEYRRAHDKLERSFFTYHHGKVIMTTGGKNLPFKRVFHAIVNRIPNYADQFCVKELQATIKNILTDVEGFGRIYSNIGISLALPMIGTGGLTDHMIIRWCCQAACEAIWNYLRVQKKTFIRHIHLVNRNDSITVMLREIFQRNADSRPPPTKWSLTARQTLEEYDSQAKDFKLMETWKVDKKMVSSSVDVSKYLVTAGKINDGDKKGNFRILGDEDDQDVTEENCVICLCEMTNPVSLRDCKHVFCKKCITSFFKTKPTCPVCGTVYGKIYGDQPKNGKAFVYVDPSSLPGYEGKETFMIIYEFPAGEQESSHPDPGAVYDGFKRRAFLPCSKEGTQVLQLLKKAFEQGMTFTIGTSRTTGKEGVITWNNIHHKTSRTGGPQKFGYPDPEYLSRVKEELACKGIVQE